MISTTKYWVWLSLALGVNTPKIKKLYNIYNSIEDFYSGNEKEWRLCGIFNEKEIDALLRTKLIDAESILDYCANKGYDVVSIDDAIYPDKLRDIYAPPSVIYVWGKLPDFNNRLSIAMVGTRKATQYGVMASHVLSASLAKLSVVVVSGGALGIDSASHIGALEAKGTTVCVLGCGFEHNYLPQNAQLRRNIAQTGAVVSEYPPNAKSLPYNFPVRNRIISALSDGVVVVEADEKSGSLITVNHALDQGREVFAVMGNINSRYSTGTNKMIKDGAVPVTSYIDIINAFPNFEIDTDYETVDILEERNNNENKELPKHKTDVKLSDTVNMIYQLISNEPIHIDKLVLQTQLPVSKVLQSLTELELLGLISCLQGRMYKLA